MNISNVRGHKLIGAVLFGLCLFAATPDDAHAWGWGWGQGQGYCCGGGSYRPAVYPVYYRPAYYNSCGSVGGYWRSSCSPVRRSCGNW